MFISGRLQPQQKRAEEQRKDKKIQKVNRCQFISRKAITLLKDRTLNNKATLTLHNMKGHLYTERVTMVVYEKCEVKKESTRDG